MNTATVLLENIIQGTQTAIWILLFIFSWIDYTPLTTFITRENLALAGIVLLAFTYWLGIMVDTVYYHLFIQRYEGHWAKKRLAKTKLTLSHLVYRCLVGNADLAKLLLERQAHLRMLRVSMINVVFITLSATVFVTVHTQFASTANYTLIIGGGVVFFVSTAFAWKKLYGYYITIAEQGYEAIQEAAN